MLDEKEKYDGLLNEYRLIWNNRLLAGREEDSKEILLDAIRRELLDENSHPRIRKNKFVKYYFAIKRVMESTVSTDAKFKLIKLHNQIIAELSEE